MTAMKSYLLSITAAAIICAVTNALMHKKSSYGTLIRFLSGIFLTVTVVGPWKNLNFDYLTAYKQDLISQSQAAVNSGVESAKSELSNIIKTKAEAYILDKAVSMDLDIEVEVTLDSADPPVPLSVTIKGAVSPYAKERLSKYIVSDLAITEDKQIWI